MEPESNILIDAVDIEHDQLTVRGRNLRELVGKVNFISSIYHIIIGQLPDADKEAALNGYLVNCVAETLKMKNYYEQLKSVATTGCEFESLTMIAVLLFELMAAERAKTLLPVELSELKDAAEGLFLMALIPVVIYISSHEIHDMKYINHTCDKNKNNFCNLALKLMAQEKSNSLTSIKLFDALLVSLHAGFGIITPTITLSRFSASTRASLAKNIVAGFSGCGASHVGACKAAMTLFKKLKIAKENSVGFDARDIFCRVKPIPGFGHPILNLDPRNEMLSSWVYTMGETFEYFTYYEQLVSIVMQDYQLRPNVDLIAAAIMLDLGFKPSLGTTIFLFARIPAMIAHALEKQKAPPFGISKKDAREHFSALPKRWI